MTQERSASTDPHHARLMDSVYKSQRHIYDVTRKYYLFGRDGTITGLDMKPGQTLLELGCGTGRNLLMASRQFAGIRAHGLDISNEMLETARAKFKSAGIPVTLVAGDATRFSPADFGLDGFDRIMIPYALSMIPDWQATIAAALDALAPGGSLHIVDFGDQAGLPVWFKSLLRAWLAKFHVTPRDDISAVLTRMCEARNMLLILTPIGAGYAIRAIARR